MKALTQRMLEQSGIDAEANPAIAALAEFAAQRSGIDARNYFSGWSDREGRKAYAQEVQDIAADLKRFREALNIAAAEGVTDADVMAEAPHAFSGRLSWAAKQHTPASVASGEAISEGDWNYVSGQYFPTEYRKAAATLLEYAARRVRKARPAETAERITTIDQLKALAERNGSCWFDRSSMRFFGTVISSGIIQAAYFITNDKRGFDDASGRGYTVRGFDNQANIRTVGELAAHDTKGEALEALRDYIKSQKAESEAA